MAAGVLKLREAVPRLIQAAGAGQADADLRSQAITALCMMPDRRAEAIYRQAASDTDPSLRRAGEKALQDIHAQVDPQVSLTGGISRACVPTSTTLRRFALSHLADPRKGRRALLRKPGHRLRPMSCRGRPRSRHTRPGPQRPGDPEGQDADHSDLIAALAPHCRRSSTDQKPAQALTPLEFTDLSAFSSGSRRPRTKEMRRR